jgi:rod shape-determining protein MreC
MAPPGNRRPGFSRRAQYGFFLSYVLAIGGVVVAVLLLAVAVIDPRGFAGIKGVALDVTAPAGNAGRSVIRFFGSIGDTVGDYFRAGSQNDALRQQLAETRRELAKHQAQDYENRRLRAMLGLAQSVEDEIAIARITGSSFESPRRLATLSAGSSSGVRLGQPVRSADGLIGRVLETGRWAARVLLVTDGASSVPVRLPRDGTPAMAVGRGDGTIELRTLEVGQNPFRVGDVLVTSGIGGIFPPNIPVARVIRLEGDTAIARPVADPARIDFAIVQRAYQPATDAPLEQAAPPVVGPPVAAPPPGPAPAPGPGRQSDPRYQPGLQQQQPGVVPPRPAPTQPQPAPRR